MKKTSAIFVVALLLFVACAGSSNELESISPDDAVTATDRPVPTITVTNEPTRHEEPTKTPTIMASSTPLPSPNATAVPMIRIVNSAVNVRSGPSMDFDSIGVLFQNDVRPLIEVNDEKTWYRVELEDGSIGWVGSTVANLENVPTVVQEKPLNDQVDSDSQARSNSTRYTYEQGAEPLEIIEQTPTIEPALTVEDILPIKIQNGEGWQLKINNIEFLPVIETNGEKHPAENDLFIIFAGDLFLSRNNDDCIKGYDFALRSDSQEYDMVGVPMDMAKGIYKVDYPGYFVGQCLDQYEREPTFLIFDINQEEFLFFEFGEYHVEIGSVIEKNGVHSIADIEQLDTMPKLVTDDRTPEDDLACLDGVADVTSAAEDYLLYIEENADYMSRDDWEDAANFFQEAHSRSLNLRCKGEFSFFKEDLSGAFVMFKSSMEAVANGDLNEAVYWMEGGRIGVELVIENMEAMAR